MHDIKEYICSSGGWRDVVFMLVCPPAGVRYEWALNMLNNSVWLPDFSVLSSEDDSISPSIYDLIIRIAQPAILTTHSERSGRSQASYYHNHDHSVATDVHATSHAAMIWIETNTGPTFRLLGLARTLQYVPQPGSSYITI